MAIWKARTATGVRAYFKVVSATGNLITGVPAGSFTVLVINPADSANQALTVSQSSQQPGVYYVDIPSAFLTTHGAGAYGLSIGVHNGSPAVNDEMLASLEVSVRDLDDIPTAVQVRDSILADGIPFNGALIDASIASRASIGDPMTLTVGEREAIADALLDLAAGVETGFTLRQTLSIMVAILAGKVTNGPASSRFRDLNDTKNRVISAADASGNRSSMIYDVS